MPGKGRPGDNEQPCKRCSGRLTWSVTSRKRSAGPAAAAQRLRQSRRWRERARGRPLMGGRSPSGAATPWETWRSSSMRLRACEGGGGALFWALSVALWRCRRCGRTPWLAQAPWMAVEVAGGPHLSGCWGVWARGGAEAGPLCRWSLKGSSPCMPSLGSSHKVHRNVFKYARRISQAGSLWAKLAPGASWLRARIAPHAPCQLVA